MVYLSQGRSNYQGNNRHEFDQDIHGWTGGVFEGITHGITGYGGFMWFRFFIKHFSVDLNAFLKRFFGIIPGTACIILKHTHQYAAYCGTGEESDKRFRAE